MIEFRTRSIFLAPRGGPTPVNREVTLCKTIATLIQLRSLRCFNPEMIPLAMSDKVNCRVVSAATLSYRPLASSR
jgi:hypothetical protein